jgi:hypothetical protein
MGPYWRLPVFCFKGLFKFHLAPAAQNLLNITLKRFLQLSLMIGRKHFSMICEIPL